MLSLSFDPISWISSILYLHLSWAKEDVKLRGTVNFTPEKSKRSGKQSEKLSKFPILLSEIYPN